MYALVTSQEDITSLCRKLLCTHLFRVNGAARKFFHQPLCIYRLAVCHDESGNYQGWAFLTHGGTLMAFVSPLMRRRGIGRKLVEMVCRNTVGYFFYAFFDQPDFFISLPNWIAERYAGIPTLDATKERQKLTPVEVARHVRNNMVNATQDECLVGMSAIGAMAVTMSLHKWGYLDAEMVLGCFKNSRNPFPCYPSHCWTIVGGRILDTTAVQFDIGKQVINCRMSDPRYEGHKTIEKVAQIPKRLRTYFDMPVKRKVQSFVYEP